MSLHTDLIEPTGLLNPMKVYKNSLQQNLKKISYVQCTYITML